MMPVRLPNVSSRSRTGRPRGSRHGLSVIELLVTLGVVSILAGILLPAVQQARERSRAIDCANRMRQLGAAAQSFEAVHQRFPWANILALPLDAPFDQVQKQKLVSAHYRLLPYLDLSDLQRSIVLEGDVWAYPQLGPPSSQNNSAAVAVRLPVFACPSDTVPARALSYHYCGGTSTSIHTTPDLPPPNSSLHGMARSGSGVRAQDVRDGLSNTMMFSERLVGSQSLRQFVPMRDVAMVEDSRAAPFFLTPDEALVGCRRLAGSVRRYSPYGGMGWLFFGFGTTVYNHVLPPNSPTPDCATGSLASSMAFTARSFHRGGVNALRADGSVRLTSQEIDLAIWRTLATIDGREVFSNP